MATKTTAKKAAATPTTEDGKYPIYEATASREAYKKGDVLFFPKVRNWLDRGNLVEAYGRVTNVAIFDNEAPFIEVVFDDKKLNKADLGKDVRKFLLEVK